MSDLTRVPDDTSVLLLLSTLMLKELRPFAAEVPAATSAALMFR
jgi:hypothetical protein